MTAHAYVVNVEGLILKDDHYLMIIRGAEESHAPGVLSMPGGKVEVVGSADDVLEATLRREIREEVGVEVGGELTYIESKSFISDDNTSVIDIVFLCSYNSGTPVAHDLGEVADLRWMTAADILADSTVPPWTRRSVELAERRRMLRV